MQLPTHFVTAVLIDQCVELTHLPKPAKVAIVAGTCYLSHGILDKLARATYHPPEPLDDGFWAFYHHKILPILTWTISLTYGPKHHFAMICSALPDLDWVVRGISRKYHREIPGWEKPVLNDGLHSFLDKVPVLNQLNRLPDLKYERKGVLIELGLVAVVLGLIQLTARKR